MARFQDILAVASGLSCIDHDVLTGKSRMRPVTVVRACAWTIGMEHGHGYAAMGRVARKDHTTVMHGVKEGLQTYLDDLPGVIEFLADLRAACANCGFVDTPLWYGWEQRAQAWRKYEFLYMRKGEMYHAGFMFPPSKDDAPSAFSIATTLKFTMRPVAKIVPAPKLVITKPRNTFDNEEFPYLEKQAAGMAIGSAALLRRIKAARAA